MKWIALSLAGCLWAAPAMAVTGQRTYFLRDSLQEQYLKTKADPDQKITPARVIRWMRGMSSVSAMRKSLDAAPTSSTEFQPTLDTYNGEYKVIAAFTFKFF